MPVLETLTRPDGGGSAGGGTPVRTELGGEGDHWRGVDFDKLARSLGSLGGFVDSQPEPQKLRITARNQLHLGAAGLLGSRIR